MPDELAAAEHGGGKSRAADASPGPVLAPPRLLLTCDMGSMDYAAALELQRAVARARIAGAIDQDVLLLVEHPHVITSGRASRNAAFVAAPDVLASRGVSHFDVERGGDVTYHGPGQLVGYPIVDLKRHKQDLHWYLRAVEEALIVTLRAYGVAGERNPGYTGVWVDGRKLASIGVHARDWVTWHGFALNVSTDLSYFDLIVPCGIAGVEMTSLARESTVHAVNVAGVSRHVVSAFEEVLSVEASSVSLEWLEERTAAAAGGS